MAHAQSVKSKNQKSLSTARGTLVGLLPALRPNTTARFIETVSVQVNFLVPLYSNDNTPSNIHHTHMMLWGKALAAFIILGKSPFATSSPITASEPVILINNGTIATTNGNHSDEVTPAFDRYEIGLHGCRHYYHFFYERWVMQVPESWWIKKYHGYADDACRAWDNALLAQRICGLHQSECWKMDKQYPSGRKGWLHARYSSCIGPNSRFFEHAFQIFDIEAELHHTDCYLGWG